MEAATEAVELMGLPTQLRSSDIPHSQVRQSRIRTRFAGSLVDSMPQWSRTTSIGLPTHTDSNSSHLHWGHSVALMAGTAAVVLTVAAMVAAATATQAHSQSM